jgi:hypothetical protein
MLVDHRTYTVKPGTMAKQAALYQEFNGRYICKRPAKPDI